MPSNQELQWSNALPAFNEGDNQVNLGGLAPETIIDALRQISNRDHVTGFTLRIVALAGNSNDEIRMWAAEALERAIEPSEDEIASLIHVLELAGDGEVCYWAATMLGRIGAAAASAGPALSDCLEQSLYLPARERSAWALCQMGDAAIVARDSLSKAAQNAPPRLKRLANEALKRIGEAA
jgi:hypothetical protein